MRLPEGLTGRAMVHGEARAVTDLITAAELHDLGEAAIDIEDIVGDWQRPSFDLANDSVGVFSGDDLVAFAEVYRTRRAEVCVHPRWRGCGIGTELEQWTREVSRRGGGTLVGQTVAKGTDPERFLSAAGYRPMWTSWVLELPEGTQVEAQPLPDGYRLRRFVPGADDRLAYDVVEDAFNEWPDRDPSSFADWASGVTGRPGFEPWQISLAVNPADEVVGVSFLIISGDCGYVDQLAVRKDERGRGLARALLVRSFEDGRAHGAARSELSTDSRTGALGLYEWVGMVVTQTWRHWAAEV